MKRSYWTATGVESPSCGSRTESDDTQLNSSGGGGGVRGLTTADEELDVDDDDERWSLHSVPSPL